MYEWLHDEVVSLCYQDESATLDCVAAVFDWLRVTLFTGSRLGEYAQSHLEKGQRFATIPLIPEAGKWAGQPLAFVEEDFTFYDRHLKQLTIEAALTEGDTWELHVRF